MRGIGKREERNSLKRLIRRLKGRLNELDSLPMFVGRTNIQNINIDDFAVELVMKYCDIDKVLIKIEELRHDTHRKRG